MCFDAGVCFIFSEDVSSCLAAFLLFGLLLCSGDHVLVLFVQCSATKRNPTYRIKENPYTSIQTKSLRYCASRPHRPPPKHVALHSVTVQENTQYTSSKTYLNHCYHWRWYRHKRRNSLCNWLLCRKETVCSLSCTYIVRSHTVFVWDKHKFVSSNTWSTIREISYSV